MEAEPKNAKQIISEWLHENGYNCLFTVYCGYGNCCCSADDIAPEFGACHKGYADATLCKPGHLEEADNAN